MCSILKNRVCALRWSWPWNRFVGEKKLYQCVRKSHVNCWDIKIKLYKFLCIAKYKQFKHQLKKKKAKALTFTRKNHCDFLRQWMKNKYAWVSRTRCLWSRDRRGVPTCVAWNGKHTCGWVGFLMTRLSTVQTANVFIFHYRLRLGKGHPKHLWPILAKIEIATNPFFST